MNEFDFEIELMKIQVEKPLLAGVPVPHKHVITEDAARYIYENPLDC